MLKFTKTGLFCVFSLIIFIIIQVFIHQYSIENEINEEIINFENTDEKPVIKTTEKSNVWEIEIPKISLIANISEGTTKDVLNLYVGHFENTARQQGNVGLAAHNRGYNVNYFKDLRLLKEGDEIRYKYNEYEMTYIVEKCRIIKDTEWQYLEETEENMLTLITCVENEPEYRRCIQAVEKKEEIY